MNPSKPTTQVPSLADKLKAADLSAQSQSSQLGVGDATLPCPMKERHALEARVIDENGEPLADMGVELRKSDTEKLRSKTDTGGAVRFDRLQAGGYQLSLYELDQEAWEWVKQEALPEALAKSTGDAAWQNPTPPSTEKTNHVVIEGECITKLAERYGFFPDTLWDWPDNAKLKQKREDMNILAPDDTLVIPARRDKAIPAQTGDRYYLKRKGITAKLRVRFLIAGQPRKNVPYSVSVSTLNRQTVPDRQGMTDMEGFVSVTVPPSATTATVILGQGEGQDIYEFNLGYIDPIDTVCGIQGRLRNLGYYFGEENGNLDEDTVAAIKLFQLDHKINVSGEVDQATRAELKDRYLA
jgi:hypothetical protein